MYDLKPLEEEWEKYHKKKRLPFYIGILIGVFLITMMLFSLYYDLFPKKSLQNNIDKVGNTKSVVITSNNEIINNTSKNELEKTIVEKKGVNKPLEMIVDNIPILEEETNKVIENKNVIDKPRKRMHLDIVETSSLDAYKDVEERFFKSRNLDDSLFLAKSYYKKGLYEKSEYWALQTNKINSTIDDSWIIFTQSKVKLGQKNEAINILQSYIKRTGSERAKNVLIKIKANR